MVKGSMQQKELTIVNIHAPNTGAPRYINKFLATYKEVVKNLLYVFGCINNSGRL